MSMAGGRLDYVTSRVREREYEELNLTKEQQREFDAYRLTFDEFLKQPVLFESQDDQVTNLEY